MRFAISNLDIFYISYDEPRADQFFADLQSKAPKPIKRVHGVKGFHAAHRRCAEQSTTKRFVTIDGDNIVHASLFFQQLDDEDQKDLVFSFKARNAVNGLEYGNGGVKVWPRGLVLQVPTHEHAGRDDPARTTDFCWTYRYMQVNTLVSDVYANQSPLHACRSGYREGVKMSLIEGKRLRTWQDTLRKIHPTNLSRLKVWASVGADAENGLWSILGTRAALFDMWSDKAPWPIIENLISDYDAFKMMFEDRFAGLDVKLATVGFGYKLNDDHGMHIVDLDEAQSIWFKATYINPPRAGIMLPHLEPVDFSDD